MRDVALPYRPMININLVFWPVFKNRQCRIVAESPDRARSCQRHVARSSAERAIGNAEVIVRAKAMRRLQRRGALNRRRPVFSSDFHQCPLLEQDTWRS